MGRIPEATIHEIRDRADIVGLIGRYVELKQAGRNWKGLCPFHDEKTPSFNVVPDRQIFHCFGCEKGGDVFAFLMEHEGLTFPEAARSLAGELGIEIPETGTESRDRGEREQIYSALSLAQDFYRKALDSAEAVDGRAYLADRGIEPDVVERFGLGFAPERGARVAGVLRTNRVDASAGVAAGLLKRRDSDECYDFLRGRLTFPIRDVRGRVIAFAGRSLGADQQPKYLNTPESPVYHKRSSFYGFPQALEPIRRAQRAVVCEGYFDAIALHRAGVGEALATCGTALTADHARELKRRTGVVSLLFDGDSAGQKAMERALEILLPAGLRVRAVALPTGQDPDDYLASEGPEALRGLIDDAPDALEIVIRRALAQGFSTPAEKADVVRHVAPLVALIPGAVERSGYSRRLAIATDADPSGVEDVVRDARQGGSRTGSTHATAEIVSRKQSSTEDRHLRHLALIFWRHPDLATPELVARLRRLLPGGVWKGLVFRLIEAADEGCVDGDGTVDLFKIEERLSAEELALVRGLSTDEWLLESETPVPERLEHLLAHYHAKDLEARENELKRRLHDPNEDAQQLLKERQALLDEKRAAAGIAMG